MVHLGEASINQLEVLKSANTVANVYQGHDEGLAVHRLPREDRDKFDDRLTNIRHEAPMHLDPGLVRRLHLDLVTEKETTRAFGMMAVLKFNAEQQELLNVLSG